MNLDAITHRRHPSPNPATGRTSSVPGVIGRRPRRRAHRALPAAVALASLGLMVSGGSVGWAAEPPDPTTTTTTVDASTTTTTTPASTAVSGLWNNPEPNVIVSSTPEGDLLHIVLTSGTIWYCSLAGSTTFTIDGTFDPATGVFTGTIDETFTGSVVGAGTGTLHLTETITQQSDGYGVVDATIVSGTGDLSAVTGSIRFVGQTDPTGVGSGTYTGTLQLPADPPDSAPTSSSCDAVTPVSTVPVTTAAPSAPAATPVATSPAVTG